MSSGSPSQIVHEVGGPIRGNRAGRQTGSPEQLALEVVEGPVERRLGGVLARDLGEPLADLLQRERVVAEQVSVLLDERERRLRRLVVAVDRRRLAPTDVPVVAQLDLHDVLPVARLARDHERLRQARPDDGGLDSISGAYFAAPMLDVGVHAGWCVP